MTTRYANGAAHSREEETAPVSPSVNQETTRLYHGVPAPVRAQPVSPAQLAAEARIPVLSMQEADTSHNCTADTLAVLDGLFVTDRKRWSCILLNSTRPKKRLRFTLAHEIAHVLRSMCGRSHGQSLLSRDDEDRPEERLCNRIAAEILMPADLLSLSIIKARGKVNPYKLAREFGVSLTAMRVRLHALGLL